ncbi:MAG: ATP-binding protein [Desulfobacteraceae bacterium]|nr:ATP-binding protein [Desulfobacteraceae bacterium]
MSLMPRIPNISKTIGFKIAAAYSLLLTFSFVGLNVFAYLFLETTLARQSRRMIAGEVESLQEQYRIGGRAAFDHKALENDSLRKNNPFFTRAISSPRRPGRVFFPQYWKDFDLTALEDFPGQTADQWISFPNRDHTYALEIYTAGHSDGTLFQVGISTEDRLAILRRYKESFLVVSAPLILLAVGGGAFLSRRALRPLRNLIETVVSIEAGKMDARVPVSRTGDELDELGRLFNRMIEKINQLIQGMRASLDSVAHDLRTPMTHFRNIAETALQQEQSLPAFREALQECMDESDRILRMLHMLMDISEAQAGTMRLDIKPMDLVPVAESMADMYRYVGEERGIRIETHLPPDAMLEADADRIGQALANLLDNAVKFTPPEGLVRVIIHKEPDHILMQVSDSGAGIPSEEIHRIWDRLFRGAQATHQGLGLGLSMVKAVVEAHEGEIRAQSTPGVGSIFTVQLPRRHHR